MKFGRKSTGYCQTKNALFKTVHNYISSLNVNEISVNQAVLGRPMPSIYFLVGNFTQSKSAKNHIKIIFVDGRQSYGNN